MLKNDECYVVEVRRLLFFAIMRTTESEFLWKPKTTHVSSRLYPSTEHLYTPNNAIKAKNRFCCCLVRSTITIPKDDITKMVIQQDDECSSLVIDSSAPKHASFDFDGTRLKNLPPGEYGTLGSTSIAVNFLTGPAMLEIPALFQKSGLIPTTLCIIIICASSSLGNLHFANAISKLPGNYNFDKQVEYSDAFRHYWPNNPIWFQSTQLIFFLCVTCLTMSSLADSAQVFDMMLANGGFLGGKSYALRFVPSSTTLNGGFDCFYESWDFDSCSSEEDCVPFSDHEDQGGILLTFGYLLNVIFFMPLALMDLQENAVWQVVEFFVLLITTVIFSVLFISNGLEWEGRLSWWGESYDSLFGVILFNFALVVSIPAWLYEKGKKQRPVTYWLMEFG